MRKTQLWTSELGTGADQPLGWDLNGVLYLHKAVSGYNRFCIRTIAGSVRVKASLNGTDIDQQLTMSQEPAVAADAPAEQFGTIVAVTTVGVLAWFTGDYRGLRFEQVGATPAQVQLLGAADDAA